MMTSPLSTSLPTGQAPPHSEQGHWLQVDTSRRTSLLLRKAFGALGAVVVLGAILSTTTLWRATAIEQRAEETTFGALLSVAPTSAFGDLAASSEREAMRVTADGSVTVHLRSDSVDDRPHSRWRDQTRRLALASSDSFFVTTDPRNRDWWHVTLPSHAGSTIVVSRPAAEARAVDRGLITAILGLSALTLFGIALTAWVLTLRIARPLRTLVGAGEDLTVRGEMREANRAQVSAISRARSLSSLRFQPPSEFRALARIIEQLEKETMQGQTQAESLLGAAEALGTSLDPQTIMSRSIEQLHSILGSRRAVIVTYQGPHMQRPSVVASLGHDPSYPDDYRAGAIDGNLASRRAIREGRPVQVSDTESRAVSASLRDRARRHGFRSMLAVPLGSNLKNASALVLYMEQPHTFSFDEVQLAQSFAGIAGAALRNAELFAETDESLRRQTYQLDAIVESVEQGLLVEGTDGEVLYANRMMQGLFPHVCDEHDLTLERIACDIESQSDEGELIADQLRRLTADPAQWVDVILCYPAEGASLRRAFRVRAFNVVDTRAEQIGRGQVWTDITQDRELERMKQGLLATVSHEFRTPLAIIKGYATTLLAEDVQWNPGDQREFLNLVNVEADRLTALVQRLLDMRRIDAGMVELQRIPIDLDIIVQSTLDAMPHHRSRIRLVDGVPALTIAVDAARIVTVLRNLLENACSYSPDDQPVDLSLSVIGEDLRVSVRDRGPGVPDHMVERIFETFVRADASIDADFGGIGLGLAIARGFIHAHQGRIHMRRPLDGIGAEFVFTIPLSSTDLSGRESHGVHQPDRA